MAGKYTPSPKDPKVPIGPQMPEKYGGRVGPNYLYYGEQPGYTYNPADDTYYSGQAQEEQTPPQGSSSSLVTPLVRSAVTGGARYAWNQYWAEEPVSDFGTAGDLSYYNAMEDANRAAIAAEAIDGASNSYQLASSLGELSIANTAARAAQAAEAAQAAQAAEAANELNLASSLANSGDSYTLISNGSTASQASSASQAASGAEAASAAGEASTAGEAGTAMTAGEVGTETGGTGSYLAAASPYLSALALGIQAYYLAQHSKYDDKHEWEYSTSHGAQAGAAGGALIGSYFGGVGALPGAVIGGVIGGIGGFTAAMVGGGKPAEQAKRDDMRRILKDSHLIDDGYNLTLPTGVNFNIGDEDGRILANIDESKPLRRRYDVDFDQEGIDQVVRAVSPLANIFTAADPLRAEQLTGYLTNAVTSTGNVTQNVRELYNKTGLTYEEAFRVLNEMDITPEQRASLQDEVNQVYGGDVYKTPYVFSAQATDANNPHDPISEFPVGGMTTGNQKTAGKAGIFKTLDEKSDPQVNPLSLLYMDQAQV